MLKNMQLLLVAFAITIALASAQYAVNCDFENDECPALTRVQDVSGQIFILNSGGTSSEGTGPSGGAQGSSTYLYLEASGGSAGSVARLYTDELNTNGAVCVEFDYHMYGQDIDRLSLWIDDGGSLSELWSLTGNQGNNWETHRGQYRLTRNRQKLVFEARRGNGYRGDMAIDNIKVYLGTCDSMSGMGTATAPPRTTRIEVVEGYSIVWECDFDDDFDQKCQIAQDAGDDRDWTRTDQATPSSDTGPSGGYGASDGNPKYYYFLEASGVPENAVARFYSPTFEFVTVPTCARLEFFYSMYGLEDMGSLEVGIIQGDSKERIFSKSGDQGIDWIKADEDVTIPSGQFRMYFEATRGSGYHSDIAVDEIQFIDCTEKETGKTTGPPTRPTGRPTERPSGAANVQLNPRFVFIDRMPGQVVCTVRNTAGLPFSWNGIKWYDNEGRLVDENKPGVIVETVYSPHTSVGTPNDFWASTLTVDSADYTMGGLYSCEVDYDDEVTIRDAQINIKGCPRGEYMCKSGGCIPCDLLCDGHNDCGDYSDEFKCGTDRSPMNSMGCTES